MALEKYILQIINNFEDRGNDFGDGGKNHGLILNHDFFLRPQSHLLCLKVSIIHIFWLRTYKEVNTINKKRRM